MSWTTNDSNQLLLAETRLTQSGRSRKACVVANIEDLNEIDKLSWYVVEHYQELLTPDEIAALRAMRVEMKQSASDSPQLKGLLNRRWAAETEKSKKMLALGIVQFYDTVRNRLLSEHADSIEINTCPHCDALARTPRARQCPECSKRW